MNIKIKRLYAVPCKKEKFTMKMIKKWDNRKAGVQVFYNLQNTLTVEFLSYTSFRWEHFRFKSERW